MKLAVLTSGGDSAGMNSVVRAVVKAGILKYVPFHFPMGDASFNAGAHTEDVRHGSFEKDMKASFAETQMQTPQAHPIFRRHSTSKSAILRLYKTCASVTAHSCVTELVTTLAGGR
jgi:hypothetical protein